MEEMDTSIRFPSFMRDLENDPARNFVVKTSVRGVITSSLGLESHNADRRSSKRRRLAREKATGCHRLTLLLCSLVHVILLFIAIVLAATTRTSFTNYLRLFYISVALLLNLSAPAVMMWKDIYFGLLGQLMMSLCSLVLEMSMFALVDEEATVFVVGIMTVCLSCFTLIIALVGLQSLLRIAPESTTEEWYTNFASKAFWASRLARHAELQCAVEEILDGSPAPESTYKCRLLVAKALNIVNARDEQADLERGPSLETPQGVSFEAREEEELPLEFRARESSSTPRAELNPMAPGDPPPPGVETPPPTAEREEGGQESPEMALQSVSLQSEGSNESGSKMKEKGVNLMEKMGQEVSQVKNTVKEKLGEVKEAIMEKIPEALQSQSMSISVGDSKGWGSWHAANRIRHLMYANDRKGAILLLTILLIVTFLCLGNIVYEFAKIFMNQPPTIPEEVTVAFNELGRRTKYFPERSHNTWKVHLVVMDGLREDMMDSGASAMGDYINSAAFAPYSLRFRARAQVPTFSVPNWMSILTGSKPEMHGVTGNLGNSETEFDHIFSEAKDYGLHTGMTGTPWWKSLVFSTLPPLDGDGTVDTTFNNGSASYDWITSNPGDEERLRVSLKAARRSTVTNPFGPDDVTNLYDFFLTHFSDIDAQGHEYGVDTKYNTRDTYQGAVSNKTDALMKIVDAIDSQTVLVMTSDHGHVRRGGHGGISDILKHVPLIFYVKGKVMNLTTSAAREFTTTSLPRNLVEGDYQNLDICATICSLLGIPTPRQTQGIFVEEALEALLPSARVKGQHFHDLYMAKRASVGAYAEYLKNGLFADRTQDSLLTDSQAVDAFNTSRQKSNAAYAGQIRKLDEMYIAMRNEQASFAFVRNLLASLLIMAPCVLCVCYVFSTRTAFKVNRLTKNPNITRAFWAGFLTLILYLGATVVIFLIGYFAILGYTVWDSTLVHTTSFVRPFLQGVVVGPVVVYLILTKLYLAPLIQWQLMKVTAEFQEGFSMTAVLRWITYAMRDMVTFLFTTRQYRANRFGDAYLYLLSLVFWTLMVSLLISVLLFPFTYFIPVVLSSNYVDDFNLEWRFRLITLLMMMLPMQVGAMILLSMRPHLGREELILWDECFIKVHMATALRQLTEQSEAEKAAGHQDKETEKLTKLSDRLKLLKKSMVLLCDPEYRVHSEDLHQNGYFPMY